ncbi:MAG: LUD domain-containing protein [Flavobacteriaceae bacterium]|nr:LUD domain-containing protein [Flavobacteriaceae bacterium]
MFKKLASLFKKDSGKKASDEEVEVSKYMPETDSLTTEERFTQNFIQNNGRFVYCENTDILKENIDNILQENDWYEKNAATYSQLLKQLFSNYNLKFTKAEEADIFLCECEFLVAQNGSILISSEQIKEQKLSQLPENFIVYAKTSQIINSLSEGLQGIKRQKKKRIPTNITTIKHFGIQEHEEVDFMKYGSSFKTLYLLLLEDL